MAAGEKRARRQCVIVFTSVARAPPAPSQHAHCTYFAQSKNDAEAREKRRTGRIWTAESSELSPFCFSSVCAKGLAQMTVTAIGENRLHQSTTVSKHMVFWRNRILLHILTALLLARALSFILLFIYNVFRHLVILDPHKNIYCAINLNLKLCIKTKLLLVFNKVSVVSNYLSHPLNV